MSQYNVTFPLKVFFFKSYYSLYGWDADNVNNVYAVFLFACIFACLMHKIRNRCTILCLHAKNYHSSMKKRLHLLKKIW